MPHDRDGTRYGVLPTSDSSGIPATGLKDTDVAGIVLRNFGVK